MTAQPMTYAQAGADALARAMREDPMVVALGEDLRPERLRYSRCKSRACDAWLRNGSAPTKHQQHR